MAGNVFLKGAKPSRHEASPVVMQDFDPALRLREENGAWFLDLNVGWPTDATGPRVTSELLGKTLVSKQPFVNPAGSPFQLDHDFHGKARTGALPAPGPVAGRREGKQTHQLPARQ